MPTTAEKLWEATRTLPEPLLAEVLDFAEFLHRKRLPLASAVSVLKVNDLCGGLETSTTFAADPLDIQRTLRDEWR